MVNVNPASSLSDEITSVDSDIANDPILDSSKLSTVSLPFIKNQGQLDDTVKLYVNTFAGTVFVTSDGLTYSIIDQNEDESFNGISIRETLLNSNPLNIIGIDQSESIVNYFIGKQENWQSNIPTYNGVSLGEVWPSIDVTLKAYGNNVEKIFTVTPGGTVHDIALSFDGIDNLSVSSGGDLLLDTELGMISMTAPTAYQYIDGVKNNVEAYYTINGNEYGFVVGEYDDNYDLIIDPLLASTFLGGSSDDRGGSVTLDSSGNVYVTGRAGPIDFPLTAGVYDETYNGGFYDIYVSKFDNDLTTLQASTLIGGSLHEWSKGIILDSSGNVFVSGDTYSSDFPTTTGAYDETFNDTSGFFDIFLFKLSNDLTSLLASTYLGGNSVDALHSYIDIDSSGNVFIAGVTSSSDFPSTVGSYNEIKNGFQQDAFVTKFNNDLTSITSTFIGGSSGDSAFHVVLDGSDNVLIGGNTQSSDFPTTPGAYVETHTGHNDAFISKFDNNLTTLLASTFISVPFGAGFFHGMALDANNNVFSSLITKSPDFPTTLGAYDETFNGERDLIISKLSPDLTTLLAATYLGGSNVEISEVVAIDSSGNVFVSGLTISSDFPTTIDAYDQTYDGHTEIFSGNTEVYVSKLSNDLTTLLASTFVGGPNQEDATFMDIDSSGNVFLVGNAYDGFPTTAGAYDETYNGLSDAFIAKLDNDLSAVTVDVNGAPVAVDDAASADEQVPTLIDVLANDSDPDGDILSITSVTNPPNGNAAVVVDGSLLQTFNNPTPAEGAFFGDQFGFSVSVDGNNVLVGARHDDTGAGRAGSAYLFDATTGNLLQTFNNPTPVFNDQFGISVSVDGNNVLVGAMLDDTGATNAGSAYLFDTTGNLLQTFNNPTPGSGDQFGNSVSVAGNNVLVGAMGDDTGLFNAGSAYLFDTTGNLLQTFNNPAPAFDDRFGNSVSVAGNNVLVGAFFDDTGATDAGSAYLFDATTGNLLQTFNNPTPAELDQFGISVSVNGNNVLVGAFIDDTGGFQAGSAYLFDATTGNLLQTFNSPPPATNDIFGVSVSVDGNNVLVGAERDDTSGFDAGSAYLFDTTGNLLQTFNNPTPASGDSFGFSVSVNGNNVLVGAWRDDTGATDAGSAYLFDATPKIEYTSNPSFSGIDTFDYTISDGSLTDTATVTVTVDNTNDPPTANNDSFTVDEDTINTLDVLLNDSALPDTGETLTITVADDLGTLPNAAGAAENLVTNIRFTPSLDFNGVTSFDYRITDGNGGTATAIVTVTVNPIPDPPVATDDPNIATEINTAKTIDVLANDSDPDNPAEPLQVISVTQGTSGGVTFTVNDVTYTPDPEVTGPDSFTYTIQDSTGLQDIATCFC